MSNMSEIDAAPPEEKIKTVINLLSKDNHEYAQLCTDLLTSALEELEEE